MKHGEQECPMRKLAILFTLIAIPAQAETQFFYGNQGQDIGSSQSAGTSKFYYDASGNNVATSLKAGNTTYYYGSDGSNIGSSMSVGGNRD
jgi:YD repeat-containing protein